MEHINRFYIFITHYLRIYQKSVQFSFIDSPSLIELASVYFVIFISRLSTDDDLPTFNEI